MMVSVGWMGIKGFQIVTLSNCYQKIDLSIVTMNNLSICILHSYSELPKLNYNLKVHTFWAHSIQFSVKWATQKIAIKVRRFLSSRTYLNQDEGIVKLNG